MANDGIRCDREPRLSRREEHVAKYCSIDISSYKIQIPVGLLSSSAAKRVELEWNLTEKPVDEHV